MIKPKPIMKLHRHFRHHNGEQLQLIDISSNNNNLGWIHLQHIAVAFARWNFFYCFEALVYFSAVSFVF